MIQVTEEDITTEPSPIPYSYTTIKITSSRIDKGLIAFPRALTNVLPSHNTDVLVYLGEASRPSVKPFSHLFSRTKRITIGRYEEMV